MKPIGICETVPRIITKAVLHIIKYDLQEATGCQQLCAGQVSGIEAAFHAMKSSFENDDSEAVLLVDVSNALNSLNRQVALHNARHL